MVIAEEAAAAAAAAAAAVANCQQQSQQPSLPPPPPPPPLPQHNDAPEIDLKCGEKVTDSDSEEPVDVDDSQSTPHTQFNHSTDADGTVPGGQSTATNNSCDASRARDFTCKPKAIKAQRQNVDAALLNYQQIPLYAFNSPKNPTGILPFQPTGKHFY